MLQEKNKFVQIRHERIVYYFLQLDDATQVANNETSGVCDIIKPGRRIKLYRSQAVNVHKHATMLYNICTQVARINRCKSVVDEGCSYICTVLYPLLLIKRH